AATLDDGQCARAGHDATVARYYEALKPGLPGDPRQVLRGLLEAGCCVSFVECDVHCNGTGTVHSAQGDHATALINDHGRDLDVQLHGLCMGVAYHLNCFFARDSHCCFVTLLGVKVR